MKYIALALLAIASLSLGGCLTTDIGSVAAGDLFAPQIPVGAGPTSSGTGFVAAVVRGAQTGCNYRPSDAVVRTIALAEPVATPISELAKAFCDGAAPLASGPGMIGVRQGYVHINGHYYSIRTGKRVFFARHAKAHR